MGTVEQDLSSYLDEQDRLQREEDRFEAMCSTVEVDFNEADRETLISFASYCLDYVGSNESVGWLHHLWVGHEAEKRIKAEDEAYEPHIPYEDL